MAQHILAEVAALAIPHSRSSVADYVTVSIGVAMIGPEESCDGFLNRTDQAMYLAKTNGRNRVEISNCCY